MSKMSKISAEMDEKNIPTEKRNSLIDRVSEGMHAAEKKIDSKKIKVEDKSSSPKKAALKIFEDDTLEIIKKIRAFADRTHNVVTIDGKSYVKAGVYQYLTYLLGITPSFEFEPESTQEEVWCTCRLYNDDDGGEVTHTTMYADKKELFLRDKPDYAVLGMAQTRAFVRAMKNVYGFLIEAAGYQAIAIEEIEMGEK